MAIKLTAGYCKRLGLPGSSSHQFGLTIEAELSSADDIAGESARLYETLQQSVDEQIRNPGFVPGETNGNGDRSSSQNGSTLQNGNGQWQCSDRQKELILTLIRENQLDKDEIESLARDRFEGKGVKELNRLQASGLIDELLERVGEKPERQQNRGVRPGHSKGGAR